MAKRVETITTVTDDLDGSKADRTVTFSWEGNSYEIDLSKRNATAFEKVVAPYMQAGRRVRSMRAVRATRASRPKHDLAVIREWAKANGYDIADRGRISAEVQEAYSAAN